MYLSFYVLTGIDYSSRYLISVPNVNKHYRYNTRKGQLICKVFTKMVSLTHSYHLIYLHFLGVSKYRTKFLSNLHIYFTHSCLKY